MPSARQQAAAARLLLRSSDPQTIQQGVELICALADPQVTARVLAGVRYEPVAEAAGERSGGLVLNNTFSGSGPAATHRLMALLRILGEAQAPRAAAVREALVDLEIVPDRGASVDLSALSGLDRLERLQVVLDPGATGLDTLARLPALRDLELTILSDDTDLSFLAGAPRLSRLEIWAPGLERLDGLEQIPTLRELIVGSEGPVSAGALAPGGVASPALERVLLPALPGREDAAALAQIPWLQLGPTPELAENIRVGRRSPPPLGEALAPEALSDAGRWELSCALEALDRQALIQNMPRQGDGSLFRRDRERFVLLAPLETPPGLKPGQRRWLAAEVYRAGRAGGVHTERLRLVCVDRAAAETPHDWRSAPWRWRVDAEPPTWHADVLAYLRGNAISRLGELLPRCESGSASPAERIACCVLLQDAGRFDEAFALFGIALASDDIDWSARGWGGERARSWRDHLLRRCAPWALPALLDAEVSRLEAERQRKRQRRRKAPAVTLGVVMLTGATSAPTMRLKARPGGAKPRVIVELRGRPGCTAEPLWQRPIEWDLARFAP